jgi:hypothetical protein
MERHIPAGEVHQGGAQLDVFGIKRRFISHGYWRKLSKPSINNILNAVCYILSQVYGEF